MVGIRASHGDFSSHQPWKQQVTGEAESPVLHLQVLNLREARLSEIVECLHQAGRWNNNLSSLEIAG
jgi:hypothetical protein